MKLSALSSLSVLSLLTGTLTLAGCGGAFSMPDSIGDPAAPSVSVIGPPIQGSVFGGHAPIQGAHVYLLQPGTTGYGSLATSILGTGSTTSPGGYPLTADTSDPNVPLGSQYVTTDAQGQFNLTNAYTCVSGQPVYIYAYGGNIGTTTGAPVVDTLTITSTSTAYNLGNFPNVYTQTFNYAVTGSTVPPTVGETVNLTLTGGLLWNTLTSVVVASVNAATGQFTGQADGTATFNSASGTASYSTTTIPATANSSIVQLATLGNCPGTSGEFAGAIKYVYLNEVSTVATAYTFQPFTLVTNNDAWHIGFPATMPAYPVTTPASTVPDTQALLGITDAATTAAQLYNIQGSSTLISSAGDGEGHLANIFTVAANGIVPQATIDKLANILAACVDSVPGNTGAVTTTCANLFSIATDDGTTTGTQPIDTATAAINIARYPAGNNSSNNVDPNYVSDIYNITSGTVPYVPQLMKVPNDWTIAINYPAAGKPLATAYSGVNNTYFAEAESIAVDALGQIWITDQGNDGVVRITSQGAVQPPTAQTYPGYIPGYVSIDGLNNAWTGNANCNSGNTACPTGTPISLAGSNGVFTSNYGNNYFSAYTDIADFAGDDYFFGSTSTNSTNQMYEYPAGASTSSTPNAYSLSTTGFGAGNVAHGAIDASGNFWLTAESGNYQIAKVSPTGTKLWLINTGVQQPEFVAIDNNGTGWIPSQTANGPIYKITSAGASTSLTSSSTGANFSYPFGSAVDGNGNVWITNRCGAYNQCGTGHNTYSNTLIELNGTGTNGTLNHAISPSTNYLPEAQYPSTATTLTPILTDPLNLAIDPSGNIWITNYTNNPAAGGVVEIVGAAAPVVTPLSTAATLRPTSKLGAKP